MCPDRCARPARSTARDGFTAADAAHPCSIQVRDPLQTKRLIEAVLAFLGKADE
jgi:hypothetical protein